MKEGEKKYYHGSYRAMQVLAEVVAGTSSLLQSTCDDYHNAATLPIEASSQSSLSHGLTWLESSQLSESPSLLESALSSSDIDVNAFLRPEYYITLQIPVYLHISLWEITFTRMWSHRSYKWPPDLLSALCSYIIMLSKIAMIFLSTLMTLLFQSWPQWAWKGFFPQVKMNKFRVKTWQCQ